MKKNIVVIIDGTSCSAVDCRDRDLSNAFRLASVIDTENVEGRQSVQIINYFPGPGARNAFSEALDAIFGEELREIIGEAYLSIVSNFDCEENCDIFLFGFSRGAIAVKILAEIICRVGILNRDSCYLLRHIWSVHQNQEHPDRIFLVDRKKSATIKFVGLFDPVHGPVNQFLDLIPNEYIDDEIENAVEVCALDETRIGFNPSFWSEYATFSISAPGLNDKNMEDILAPIIHSNRASRLQHIFLPGGHSDIGSSTSRSTIADLALLAMIERVANLTDLPFLRRFVGKIVTRILSEKNSLLVHSGHTIMFGSYRTVASKLNIEIHPVYDLMIGKKINSSFSKGIYKSKAKFQIASENLARYAMNISSILDPSDRNVEAEVIAALLKNLAEV